MNLYRIKRIMSSAPLKSQHGLSMIELMISLLISTMLMAGLAQVFSVNRTTYKSDEGMARLQENARFTLDFLTRDLRTAGDFGCMSAGMLKGDPGDGTAMIRTDSDGTALNLGLLATPVLGHDATAIPPTMTAYTLPTLYPPTLTTVTNPAIDATLAPAGGVVTASDALLIRTMDQEVYNLAVDLPSSGSAISISGNPNLANGQQILVTNCRDGVMINKVVGTSASGAITTITVNPYTGMSQFSEINRYTGQLATLRTMLYYVGIGSNNGPALFSRNFSDGVGTPQELVEGVENLQFIYGVSDGVTTMYKPATTVLATEWPTVVSVRIAMLVATSNVATRSDTTPGDTSGGTEREVDANTYTLQGITLTPNADNRRRRVFESSVRVRNIGIGSGTNN